MLSMQGKNAVIFGVANKRSDRLGHRPAPERWVG
jgi:enoyl-[acyl-carrier-protein] reductase (NADH)